jgi:hypothetical protein
MTKLVPIGYGHPVENDLPNLHKVKAEREFGTEQEALCFVHAYNNPVYCAGYEQVFSQAVYYGKVNDETGELV